MFSLLGDFELRGRPLRKNKLPKGDKERRILPRTSKKADFRGRLGRGTGIPEHTVVPGRPTMVSMKKKRNAVSREREGEEKNGKRTGERRQFFSGRVHADAPGGQKEKHGKRKKFQAYDEERGGSGRQNFRTFVDLRLRWVQKGAAEGKIFWSKKGRKARCGCLFGPPEKIQERSKRFIVVKVGKSAKGREPCPRTDPIDKGKVKTGETMHSVVPESSGKKKL